MDSPAPISNQSFTVRNNSSALRMWTPLVVALVVLAGGFGFLYYKSSDLLGTASLTSNFVASEAYQAVFLTSGQVYFGKMELRDNWVILKDVFYLQVTDTVQPAQDLQATEIPANFQLIKLGSEIHGPEDQMFIEQDKVLFWENMKLASQVVRAIERYKQTGQ